MTIFGIRGSSRFSLGLVGAVALLASVASLAAPTRSSAQSTSPVTATWAPVDPLTGASGTRKPLTDGTVLSGVVQLAASNTSGRFSTATVNYNFLPMGLGVPSVTGWGYRYGALIKDVLYIRLDTTLLPNGANFVVFDSNILGKEKFFRIKVENKSPVSLAVTDPNGNWCTTPCEANEASWTPSMKLGLRNAAGRSFSGVWTGGGVFSSTRSVQYFGGCAHAGQEYLNIDYVQPEVLPLNVSMSRPCKDHAASGPFVDMDWAAALIKPADTYDPTIRQVIPTFPIYLFAKNGNRACKPLGC